MAERITGHTELIGLMAYPIRHSSSPAMHNEAFATLGLGRLISLPFAGPLSDKLGRRFSIIIGCASYVVFLVGIAFSPNTTIAYIAAVLGGIANSFLDTATYPAVAEIIYEYTGIATMGIKLFISVAQLLMPFFLGVAAGTMVALFVTSVLITKFKQVKFLVIYPAISLIMLALVYMIKTPMICYIGAFVLGYAAAGGVLQMATAVVNNLFPKIKGTITSLVMIASSLCNYTILTAAAKMTSTNVIVMNIVITAIGVLLALFVNLRYDVLLKNTENQ